MKIKKLGLIGGLGPESGTKFYLNINRKFKPLMQRQPAVILDNLPVSLNAEREIIHGNTTQEHLELLLDSVYRLNNLNVHVIAIACNTVHIFIKSLRENSNVQVLSIIEETVKKCKKDDLQRVGILASTKTVKSNLYADELEKENISVVIPNEDEQEFVSDCIIRIINENIAEDDKEKLEIIINNLKIKGAQAVVLACTELPLIITDKNNKDVINATETLENAVVDFLMN